MRGLALILALLPCVAAAQSLDEGITGGRSVVASRYQFGSTGGDWPSPVPPTIDCRLSAWSSGTLDCGGATFTPAGSPTAGVPTYWHPGGGAVAGSGVGFDGTDDFLDAGDVGDQAGDFTVCARFTGTGAGYKNLVVKGADAVGGGANGFGLYSSSSYVTLGVTRAAGSYSTLATVTPVLDGSNVYCASYDYVTSGSSVILANLNGAANSKSDAVGPTQDTAGSLKIGGPAGLWDKSISNVTLWSGWAASAADLARMVRSQYAAQGSLGEPLTVSGPATSAVLTRSDGSPFVAVTPANQPSIVADGVQVPGARVSRVLRNQLFSDGVWAKNGTASCVASPIAAPDGSMTAWRCTVGEYAVNDLAQAVSGFGNSASLAWSMWLSPVSGVSVTTLNFAEAASGRSVVSLEWTGWRLITASSQYVTTTAAWKSTAAGAAGFRFAAASGNSTFDIWRPWQQEGTLGPDAEVKASPLSVAATSYEVPIPAGSLWAVYVERGVRKTLDVSANASPLTIGVGKELDTCGPISSLLFCRSPVVEDCQ